LFKNNFDETDWLLAVARMVGYMSYIFCFKALEAVIDD